MKTRSLILSRVHAAVSCVAASALCAMLAACGGGGSGGVDPSLPLTADTFLDAFGSGSCIVQLLSRDGNELEIEGAAGGTPPAGGAAAFTFNRGTAQPGRVLLSKVNNSTVKLVFPTDAADTLNLPDGWAIELSNDDDALSGVLSYSSSNAVLINVSARTYTGTFSGTYSSASTTDAPFTEANSAGQCRLLKNSH